MMLVAKRHVAVCSFFVFVLNSTTCLFLFTVVSICFRSTPMRMPLTRTGGCPCHLPVASICHLSSFPTRSVAIRCLPSSILRFLTNSHNPSHSPRSPSPFSSRLSLRDLPPRGPVSIGEAPGPTPWTFPPLGPMPSRICSIRSGFPPPSQPGSTPSDLLGSRPPCSCSQNGSDRICREFG